MLVDDAALGAAAADRWYDRPTRRRTCDRVDDSPSRPIPDAAGRTSPGRESSAARRGEVDVVRQVRLRRAGRRGHDLHRRPKAAAAASGAAPQISDVSPQAMPSRCATAAASTRLFTPSLRRMFDTCTLAVLSDTNSSSPIWRLVRPAATRANTSASAASARGGGRSSRRARHGWGLRC